MMFRIGSNTSSTRFTRAAKTPSGKAMATEIRTDTLTSAIVWMDAPQRPANKQKANITAAKTATRLLAKKNAATTTIPINK
ncbi:hypothetical protein D3C81_1014230 [compost metagenome]